MRKLGGYQQSLQFGIVRLLTGLYLLEFFYEFHLNMELNVLLSPAYFHIPSTVIWLLPWVAFPVGFLFISGAFVRLSALALFFSYQLALLGMPAARIVQAPYISMILVVFALFCDHSSFLSFSCPISKKDSWHLPLFWAIYFGFTISGISKIFYHPWLNGQAVERLCLFSSLSSLMGTKVCSILPNRLLGYLVLFIEIFSFPGAVYKKTRPLAWSLNSILHFVTLIFLKIWPISLGILITQFFLFDPEWLPKRSRLVM